MNTELQLVLLLMTLLQAKHLFADFFLQTPRMLTDKARYLHMGRVQHAGLHAGLSLLALLLVGTAPALAVAICVAEWIAHFHIDWIKGWHGERSGKGPDQAGYWRAFGVDQFLHQLTYVAMLWAVAVWA
ncbi:hypothetical protein FIU94_09505 [Sulfitobacter sp. THAF37]|uniref:DUF3307 domain-containing protein n=1 Tax=Sulfitobacter sp. THAF37 TaxID=2587855 RepID=UPI0012A7C975|nr:DUF3307 domain-containing protein [Sulfitobacter sp. THAF37]QFT59059.1 hypothetical protein FIU94_09505 [Sulfitobacter sp. THAF37]